MTNLEYAEAALAQMMAPKLYELFGTPPEEMGFPIYDTKEEVETHLARQFRPVEYWTEEGRKLAASVLRMISAGGVDVSNLNIDAMLLAQLNERTDISEHHPDYE